MSYAFVNKNVFKCFLKVFKFLAVLIVREEAYSTWMDQQKRMLDHQTFYKAFSEELQCCNSD